MPVFVDNRIIAWTANIAHNSDVGGKSPGSLSVDATEIFQEGLRLPAVKMVSKGEPIAPVFEIIKINSRMPDYVSYTHLDAYKRPLKREAGAGTRSPFGNR